MGDTSSGLWPLSSGNQSLPLTVRGRVSRPFHLPPRGLVGKYTKQGPTSVPLLGLEYCPLPPDISVSDFSQHLSFKS